MEVTPEPNRLPCGRDLDDLWTRLDEPPDPHEAGCPHCQQARVRLANLARLTRQDVEREAVDPTLQPSADLSAEVLRIARAEVRRGASVPLRVEPDVPPLAISEHALAAVVRQAADEVPGVHLRRVRLQADTVAGEAAVRVETSCNVSVRASLPELLPRLRGRITDEVARRTGLRVVTVDVRVEDLFDA